MLTAMLAAKVDLSGVNGMTMDYGVPLPAGTTMADQGELALTALQTAGHRRRSPRPASPCPTCRPGSGSARLR